MAKNKKGKVIKLQPIPIKKYIIEHARKLPIKGCYTFGTTQGLTQIYVVREKRNGKVLVGFYLVDAYCLGLKNTFFTEFEDFETFYEKITSKKYGLQGFDKIDTTYAQNLIYGAIEYAEDAGFEPNKDFDITEYILDDVETLEFIDIEFGDNGKYTYWEGPDDNVKKVIATLDKNIGKGNYNFVAHFGGMGDSIGNISDFEEEDEEEDFEEDDDFNDDDEVEAGKDFPEKYWARLDAFEELSDKKIEEIFIGKMSQIAEFVKPYYAMLRICSLGINDLWGEDDDSEQKYFEDPKSIIEKSQKYFIDKLGTGAKSNLSISREMIVICLENQIHFNSPHYILLNDFIEAVTHYQSNEPKDVFNQAVYDFMLPFGFKRTNFLILMLGKISAKMYKKDDYSDLTNEEYSIASTKLVEIINHNNSDKWPELTNYLDSYENISTYLPLDTDENLKNRILKIREDFENSFD